MDASFEVSDPSDWLRTSLKQLATVETALRCQVCKDFFDTPMITSCSHTFCSLCIRRCLTNDGKCPTCRTADQELRLRRNWVLEDTVQAFKDARPALIGFSEELQLAKEQKEVRGIKRKIVAVNGQDETGEVELGTSKRKTRSQSRRSPETQPKIPRQIQDSEGDEDYQPGTSARYFVEKLAKCWPDDGLTACPICNKRMKEEEVFPHLDVHNEPARSISGRPSGMRRLPVEVTSRPRPQQKPMDRLPQISYGLMKDQALRKKLAELGIQNTGPRLLLTKRHTEWVNLVNSNYDSSRPRSKRELLGELDTWERSQGRNILNGLGGVETNSVMRKDFDGAAWAVSHGTDFQQLIARARQEPRARSEEHVKEKIGQDVVGRSPKITTPGPGIPLSTNGIIAQPTAGLPSDVPRPPVTTQGDEDMMAVPEQRSQGEAVVLGTDG